MEWYRRLGNWGLVHLVRLRFGGRYSDLCYGYNAFWRDVLPYLGVEILIWSLYALAFNLLLGTAGLPSFGHGAYFGVGAYAFGLFQFNFAADLWLCMAAALLAGTVAGAWACGTEGTHSSLIDDGELSRQLATHYAGGTGRA